MMKIGVRPEDILSDEQNTAEFNGTLLRKGTVAAFLANIAQLEDPLISEEERILILKNMEELAPAMIKIGFLNYVTFKNPVVQQMLIEAAKNN